MAGIQNPSSRHSDIMLKPHFYNLSLSATVCTHNTRWMGSSAFGLFHAAKGQAVPLEVESPVESAALVNTARAVMEVVFIDDVSTPRTRCQTHTHSRNKFGQTTLV